MCKQPFQLPAPCLGPGMINGSRPRCTTGLDSQHSADTHPAFFPSHPCLSVCRMWDQAPGFPDSGRAGGGSRALALAGQRGPGCPAHMRGLRAGPALGGDRGALCAQARLGAAVGRVPPSIFSLAVGVSCIQCPTVHLPCLLRVGPGGVCDILPVQCQEQLCLNSRHHTNVGSLVLFGLYIFKMLSHSQPSMLLDVYHHCN